MRKIITISLITLIPIACKKENKITPNVIEKKTMKIIRDSVELNIPSTWKVINDQNYLFAALMDKSNNSSQTMLLSNNTKLINLRDYIIKDLSVAIDNQQNSGLRYYVYKYYIENNTYCYILETFPKDKEGIFSFIREYNGNIYDLTFKTPKGQLQIPLKKDSLIQVIKTLKINNKTLFPMDSKPIVTDLTNL